jgi:hypothetical protein
MAVTSIHIASVAYDAARRTWAAAVEFFAPGMPIPLTVPVRVEAPQNLPHDRLTRLLVDTAARRSLR